MGDSLPGRGLRQTRQLSLKEIIRGEPELDKKMDKLNKIYYYTLVATSGVYVVNMGLMGKILYDDYHSMSTVSCTASFALLVLDEALQLAVRREGLYHARRDAFGVPQGIHVV